MNTFNNNDNNNNNEEIKFPYDILTFILRSNKNYIVQ